MSKASVRDIIIIGSGAQAKYIVDILSFDRHKKLRALVVTGEIDEGFKADLKKIDLIDGIADLKASIIRRASIIVAVSDNRKKESLAEALRSRRVRFERAIHPRAVISKSATIGVNTIINAGAVIQPYALVGFGVMVHANVVVEHNCRIEDYVNLAPGARLAGWVTVKKGAYVYTGASVIPGVTIGFNARVGAGAVVLGDVAPGETVIGNPARAMKKNAKT